MRHFIFACLSICSRQAHCTSIDITYNFVPAEAQPAIEHAADIWEGILVSTVPIKAMVIWIPMGGNALGITFPNGRRDFPSAPLPLTWYPSALANAIAAVELNPGENDFEIFLDSGTDWYYGTDGSPPSGQQDLVSAALHEMGHGLGFVGLSKKEGTLGSLGLLEMSDFAPLTASFPWPQLDTLPGVFDRFLLHPQNGPFDAMENPGTTLGSAMTSNQVRFGGANAMGANGGQAPRIYSPSVFALGSSCVHFNESTFPPGDPDELMTPFSSAGDANHWPGPVCLAVMRDIGWTLGADVGISIPRPRDPGPAVWPDPVSDRLYTDVPGAFVVRDPTGRTIAGPISGGTADVSAWPTGIYLLQAIGDGAPRTTMFIKK